jgi:ABC-type Zn2+ transport system substrate-binding protein/surface adhesin
MEGTPAKPGILDVMGFDVAPGPGAYEEMMRNLAKSARDCLMN